MFCGLSRISLFWLLLFQTGCWEQWRSSVLLQGHLWALPCLFFLEVLGLSAMDKTLGHSCQEAGPPPPTPSFASFAPLCPLLPCALRPPYYFMAAHLLSPVSQQPRATALSDAANRADCGPLSGLCSLLHGPGFSVVSGYQILNPSIIWHLLGKRRGKSFPSLEAEDGFSHTPQVRERERRSKQALA